METGKPATRAKQGRTQAAPGEQKAQRRAPVSPVSIPIEWMDAGAWRLPSGKALAEFALQAGFLAPLLLGTPFFSDGATPRGARHVTVPPVDGSKR